MFPSSRRPFAHRLFSFTLLILLRLTSGRPCIVYILDSVEDVVCVAWLDREVVGLVLRRLANVLFRAFSSLVCHWLGLPDSATQYSGLTYFPQSISRLFTSYTIKCNMYSRSDTIGLQELDGLKDYHLELLWVRRLKEQFQPSVVRE